MTTEYTIDRRTLTCSINDVDLCGCVRRALVEYLAMPGLSLTAAQMQRLWAIDRTHCDAVLDVLVTARLLQRTDTGTYVLT
jgi:hypothetical protein